MDYLKNVDAIDPTSPMGYVGSLSEIEQAMLLEQHHLRGSPGGKGGRRHPGKSPVPSSGSQRSMRNFPELDEERAASPHLAIAPCTFAADKGAKLEVEVVAPDAPQAALALSASSGVDPRTLTATASKGTARPAGKGKAPPSKGGAAKPKTGG